MIDGTIRLMDDDSLSRRLKELDAVLIAKYADIAPIKWEKLEIEREIERRQKPGLVESTAKMFDDLLGGGME